MFIILSDKGIMYNKVLTSLVLEGSREGCSLGLKKQN